MANNAWEAVMQDGYIASDDESKSSKFYFSLNEDGVPYNINTWRIEDDKNDGYPFVSSPITNVEELGYIKINSVNKFIDLINGKYGFGTSDSYIKVNLTADIDFAELGPYSWPGGINTPSNTKWYIDFRGNNHIIKNIAYTGTEYWVLFRAIYGYSNIQDLIIQDINIVSTKHIALFQSMYNYSTIHNIHVTGNLTSTGDSPDGICGGSGSGNTLLSECTFTGNLTGKSPCGISRGSINTTSNNKVANCAFIGNMTATNGSCFGITYDGAGVTTSFVRGIFKATSLIYPISKSSASLCYAVFYEGTTNTFANSYSIGLPCFYDSTEAEKAGITINSFTPATTAQLKNPKFMGEAGFSV